MREELGDVLLQVLFHARIAEDATQHAFTIDDVADSLVRKLNNRAPSVLAGESISLDEQLAQWEERKADEVRCPQGTRFAPADVPVANPAFDVTPAALITGIITERGVIHRPERGGVAKLMAGNHSEPAI